jgi:hypothetical protein
MAVSAQADRASARKYGESPREYLPDPKRTQDKRSNRPASIAVHRFVVTIVVAVHLRFEESKPVDYYAVDGTWWLPESPDHSVPGRLTFDADGLNLLAHGSLVATEAAPGLVLWDSDLQPETTPFIHGRLHDGTNVTLLEALGTNVLGPLVPTSPYRVRVAVTNFHVTADQFTEAWCEFDCLTPWAELPALAEHVPDSERYDLRVKDVTIGEASIGDSVVRLVGRVSYVVGGDRVDVKQEAEFIVTTTPTSVHNILHDWVRPLQDLVIFALGRPVRLSALYLHPAGVDEDEPPGKVSLKAVQPAPGPTPEWSTLMSYTAPTLLTFADSPLSFEVLLPAWFRLQAEVAEVLTLLHAPYYAPFMFSEHRYSSTFQSAEALADLRGHSGREMLRKEHTARVQAIVSAARNAGVETDTVEWAERVLQARNDKPLASQIRDLVLSTGLIGEAVLSASPDFGKVVTGARSGVSHPGAHRPLDAVARYWHAEVLSWIVRARILIDLGLDIAEVEHRVLGRGGFQEALDNIRDVAEGTASA